jgi:hypothetical protein
MKLNPGLKRLFEMLETIGFTHVASDITFHENDRWYARPNGATHYQTSVFLEFKPKSNGCSVAFGIGSNLTPGKIKAVLTTLRESNGIPLGLDPGFFENAPCLNMFSAGRLLSWPMLMLKFDNPGWDSLFIQFIDAVLAKQCGQVQTDESFIDFLSSDRAPFEWSLGYPLMRLCDLLLSLARGQYSAGQIYEIATRNIEKMPANSAQIDVTRLISLLL